MTLLTEPVAVDAADTSGEHGRDRHAHELVVESDLVIIDDAPEATWTPVPSDPPSPILLAAVSAGVWIVLGLVVRRVVFHRPTRA
jgi:hypothetical protein